MADMNKDLQDALNAASANRVALTEAISHLAAADMEKARPGGWTIARVLHHVIESEFSYAKLVAHLRGLPAPEIEVAVPQDGADALGQLASTRAALLQALDGVDDETLYRLAPLGANEYSVLSVIENVADHDHEHQAQIARVISHPGA